MVIFVIQIILTSSRLAFAPLCRVLSGEPANTNFKVFRLIWPGFEPTTSCTWREHASMKPSNRLRNYKIFKQPEGNREKRKRVLLILGENLCYKYIILFLNCLYFSVLLRPLCLCSYLEFAPPCSQYIVEVSYKDLSWLIKCRQNYIETYLKCT